MRRFFFLSRALQNKIDVSLSFFIFNLCLTMSTQSFFSGKIKSVFDMRGCRFLFVKYCWKAFEKMCTKLALNYKITASIPRTFDRHLYIKNSYHGFHFGFYLYLISLINRSQKLLQFLTFVFTLNTTLPLFIIFIV